MSKKSSKKKSKTSDGTTPNTGRTISENRRAKHKYEIQEQLECGIILTGSEVKSLRDGKVSLDEAYVRITQGEAWLIGADIPEYPQANIWNHLPKRPRKLLAHGRQLRKLAERTNEKGLTLIPLRVYLNARGIIKIMVGVGKGKKQFDKREAIKKADVKRRLDRISRRR